MNSTKRYALLLSSISIYKNVISDEIISAFYKLLNSTTSSNQEFINSWSNFYSMLVQTGYQDDFSGYVNQTILYDENIFTLEATKNNVQNLPESIQSIVKTELDILLQISNITPDDIFNAYSNKDELAEIRQYLPNWKNNSIKIDSTLFISKIINFNKDNGYGIFAKYIAFIWRDKNITPVKYPDTVKLSDFKEYEYQRNLVLENTVSFLNNTSANNCLLYGDKGTGKSSTVKAILNKHYKNGLRMIEIPKERLCDFPIIVDKIANIPMKFIIFIDDLSFQKQDDTYASLKALLEGGLASKPNNTLIYATSNRRHLVKENFSDRHGDELHRNDTIQESLSLSDRFGLTVNFSSPNKTQYLNIVKSLAIQKEIDKDEKELFALAERWALQKGGRSPRTAKQFINTLKFK